MPLQVTDCELSVAFNIPLVSIAPCRVRIPLQVAAPKGASTKFWLKLNVLPFNVTTSGNISEPLSMLILPSSLTVIITGMVSDSVSPSAEADAFAVPIYVPAIDETGAGCTVDTDESGIAVTELVLPPPLDVSLLLSLLQPEINNNTMKRVVMRLLAMFK